MINPATLIPTPVHKIARSLGRRDIIKISHCSLFPVSNDDSSISITPTKSEITDRITRLTARINVNIHCFRMLISFF